MSDTKTTEPYTHWSLPHSLYSGKTRAYLIKKGLPFRDLVPTHPHYHDTILPTVGHLVVPIVETPDGAILQDSTEIIEYLEVRHPGPLMNPTTSVQRIVALLIDAFGSEGLLPAAMHYRWSYREQQENFLRAEFGRVIVRGPDREERQAAGAGLMDYFNGFLPPLGVNPGTIDTIESNYLEFLDALDIHLQHYPYIMGGRPSVADFGLMAPLFAHLARDPVPATIMKNKAPNVYRWTERMNQPGIFDGEFYDCPESYFADDSIAPTLKPILQIIFRDWGPELLANAARYNDWIADNPDMPEGQLVSAAGDRKVHPTLGPIEYTLGDCLVERESAPHSLWHFGKALAEARALSGEAAERFADLVKQLGGEAVMGIELARPMKRENYVLVVS